MGESRSSESNHRLVPTTFPLLRFPEAYAVDADPPSEGGVPEDDAEEFDPWPGRLGGAAVVDADPPIPCGASPFRGNVVADVGVVEALRLFGACKSS